MGHENVDYGKILLVTQVGQTVRNRSAAYFSNARRKAPMKSPLLDLSVRALTGLPISGLVGMKSTTLGPFPDIMILDGFKS